MIQRLRYLGAYGMGRLSGTDLVSAMAAAITKIEGSYPPGSTVGGIYYPKGTPAWQNNNPGNLTYAKQAGASPGGAAGFAKFNTVEEGRAALNNQIQYQINSGQNLTQFFNQYAPPNTKNGAGAPQTSKATQAYIDSVSSQLGIDPNVPLKSVQDGSYVATAPDATQTPSDSGSYYAPDTTSTDTPTETASLTETLNGLDTPTVVGMGLGIAAVLWVVFGGKT